MPPQLPEFHPMTVLRDWRKAAPEQAFYLGDALTGAAIFGATGSGKRAAQVPIWQRPISRPTLGDLSSQPRRKTETSG